MHSGVRQFIHWLEAHREDEGISLESPASSRDLNSIEEQIGEPLPDDLRLVLARFNGGQLPSGQLLPAGAGPGTIEAAVREVAEHFDTDFLDPELLLPFHRTVEGSLLAFDRSAGPVSDTWPIVDFSEDTGEVRLIHRTFDGWCGKCVADWTAPDFEAEFTVDTYLATGLRHVQAEPDVASAHAIVAHAQRRAGRPYEAIQSYLRAARCTPALPWCDWEALKLAVILDLPAEAMEALIRLSAKAPQSRWARRETTPSRVAEVLGQMAIRQEPEERAAWLRILDLLSAQAEEGEKDVIRAVRAAVSEGSPLPAPRPSHEQSVVPAQADLDSYWAAVRQAYIDGSLRDDDMLFDPSLAVLRQHRPFAKILQIRREF
ncbi:MAG: SMI1/KNR4 family protein [Myxococcales bacterium]|nr:SMI1/KNR4 family protein [Myxococcales bacterium]